MITFLYILMILACVIIIAGVLLQPAKGGGMSALGGSNQSVFGSTGGNSFLFNVTMWSAAFIMVVSLFLSRYQIVKNRSSVFDDVSATQLPPPPAPKDAVPNTTTPTAPAANTAAAQGTATPGKAEAKPSTDTTDPAKKIANPAEATGAPAAAPTK